MYGMGNYIGWPICGQPATVIQNPLGLSGLGCGCGGRCGGCNKGLGYFDTGWDISGWSYLEWGTVLVVVYMLMSTFSTTKRGYRSARRSVKRYRSRMAE